MFDSLSEKLESVFKKLRGQGLMTEDNIKEALRNLWRLRQLKRSAKQVS